LVYGVLQKSSETKKISGAAGFIYPWLSFCLWYFRRKIFEKIRICNNSLLEAEGIFKVKFY